MSAAPGLYKSLEAGYARQFICSTHEMYLVDVSESLRTSAQAQNPAESHHLRGNWPGHGRKLAKRSDKCQDCITFVCRVLGTGTWLVGWCGGSVARWWCYCYSLGPTAQLYIIKFSARPTARDGSHFGESPY